MVGKSGPGASFYGNNLRAFRAIEKSSFARLGAGAGIFIAVSVGCIFSGMRLANA